MALVAGDSWLEKGDTLLVFGPPGGGKSHLAAAIGLGLIENGWRVMFTRTTDLVQRLQVDALFARLVARAARVSRKSDLGAAMACMPKRQDGFRLFFEEGRVDIDTNPVENAIRSKAMNRRNALCAGHDKGGRNRARFASPIRNRKMNGIEPDACLRDLFTSIAGGHRDKDIDTLMPSARAPAPALTMSSS